MELPQQLSGDIPGLAAFAENSKAGSESLKLQTRSPEIGSARLYTKNVSSVLNADGLILC